MNRTHRTSQISIYLPSYLGSIYPSVGGSGKRKMERYPFPISRESPKDRDVILARNMPGNPCVGKKYFIYQSTQLINFIFHKI